MTIQRALLGFFIAGALAMPLLPSQLLGARPAMAQAPAPAAQPADLPMSRAVLYSSGVAYFEHEGTITGDAAVTIPFKTEEVNDVLKSMVVIDPNGKAPIVTYPSNDPIERSLKSFGIDLSSAPQLPDLLQQLRGVQVKVTVPDTIEGKVLSVDRQTRTIGNPPTVVTDFSLVLVTAGGIRSIPFTSVQSVTIEDKRLQEELDKALQLVAAARDTQRKPVTIQFKGQGARKVRIGYLIEAPVWKSTYRLDLTDKPFLQGWALVENTSDNDWNKVGLSLISGRPISFRMDLYTPLYLDRPWVQPQYFQFLRPRLAEAGLDAVSPSGSSAFSGGSSSTFGVAGGGTGNRKAAAPPMLMESSAKRQQMTGRDMNSVVAMEDMTGPLVGPASAGGSGFAGQQVGELFRFTLPDPVTMPRRQSAMLVLLAKEVKAQKVSVYNMSVLTDQPLTGVRITNDTGMKLLSGPISVYDTGAYAGDAQLDNVSENESRLLTYGVDLSMKVDGSKVTSTSVIQYKIVKGTMETRRKYTFTQEYKARNLSDKERTLVIEHPRNPARKLVSPEKPDETTANYLRFNAKVPADKTETFTVVEEQPVMESFSLLGRDVNYFSVILRDGTISEKLRAALVEAVRLSGLVVEIDRQIARLNEEQSRIVTEQERLRQNINTVGGGSPTGQRYVKKLAEQEDRIEQINKERAELVAEQTKRRKTYEDYLSGLSVE